MRADLGSYSFSKSFRAALVAFAASFPQQTQADPDISVTSLPITSLAPASISFVSLQKSHMEMGPFREENNVTHPSSDQMKVLNSNAALYRLNRDELFRAMAACDGKPAVPNCPSYIKNYKDMLDNVKQMRNPLLQVEAVNGWVNMAINYDHPEADKHTVHRTMVEALKDGMGVCDEVAELKLAALEMLGFESDTIRYVIEVATVDTKFLDYHAVVEVRIGGSNWVMNNQRDFSMPKNKNSFTADDLMWMQIGFGISNSMLESDVTHLNFGENSPFATKAWRYFPFVMYNYNLSAVYAYNVAGQPQPVLQPGNYNSPYPGTAPTPNLSAPEQVPVAALSIDDYTKGPYRMPLRAIAGSAFALFSRDP